MPDTSAPISALVICHECGKVLASIAEFHDYVECIRVKAAVMPRRDKTVALLTSQVASLLAYIDSKEPGRVQP